MAKKKTSTTRSTRKKTVKRSKPKTVKKKTVKAAKKAAPKRKAASSTVKKKKTANSKKATTSRTKKTVKKSAKRVASKSAATPKKKLKKKSASVKATGTSAHKKTTTKRAPSKIAKPVGPVKKTTKKSTVLKKKKVARRTIAPVIQEPEPPLPTPEQLRKVKTGLTKKHMTHYWQLLLGKRAEILGDVASLKHDALKEDGALSHVPVHMADVGSDNYEQEFTLGLVESERKLLFHIDEALTRIQEKIYGVCIARAIPIGRARLDAKPWAKYCIEEARDRERRLPR